MPAPQTWTRDEIEQLPAGPELDALVAAATGIEATLGPSRLPGIVFDALERYRELRHIENYSIDSPINGGSSMAHLTDPHFVVELWPMMLKVQDESFPLAASRAIALDAWERDARTVTQEQPSE